ncbi:hypothetical protein [Streptomyces sp. SudanB182_2057]|uniref:hypothetical protein n=1 Tax=Streptomyces sp. SudanB182_2057 TaxID=3035281 RepID=UPI003F5663B4
MRARDKAAVSALRVNGERLEAAARLTAPAHADRAARLRAEAGVLLGFLVGPEPA